MHFFQWLQDHPITTPTLAVLARNSEGNLLQAASQVVDDFVLWPTSPEEFLGRLFRILAPEKVGIESARSRVIEATGLRQFVGREPVFVHVIEKLPLLANTKVPVLITGETGTGKELCARAIHHLSERRNFPFIPVECGALPDHLFENELFGHVRGAFTDAHADQKGLVAMADGGTLFLDEIDALSPAAQTKLLRFLEERTYRPLGGDKFVQASVNVITATNCDLESSVRAKQFRSDLYFRLNVLRLHLPPLRERPGDIELLAQHFLESLCEPSGPPNKSFSALALQKLALYDWPGNVRELVNVVQRAAALSPGVRILPCHIVLSISTHDSELHRENFGQAKVRAIATFEKTYVEELLGKHRGNITRAAAEAQKDRRAFGRLVKKYGIERSAL
jgi:DNA-binding NtrC family response regulator